MLRRGKGTDQNDIYQKRNSISERILFFKSLYNFLDDIKWITLQ